MRPVSVMAPTSGASAATAAALTLAAAVARTAGLSDRHHRHTAPTVGLPGGSFLEVDSELPGPNLDDGTPTKLYSLSLGRAFHNHTESAELTAAVDAKKLARRDWQGRRSLYMSFEDTPLFPGWGTHFAYVYAGTPPQRVSVIIDTGSHFTAFPCSECENCGSHTDPHWDQSKSTSSHIVTCEDCHGSFRCQKDKRCGFSQRYSEGSSWRAYQVEDVLWVGELTLQQSEKINHDESAYSVEFMFGCIESQTGLFKTQLADGIMGMSADSHTLVWQLAKAGKIKERTFSLCFGKNGGTMVIGGYDTRLNKPGHEMMYTPSTKTNGWFTVQVTDITVNRVSIAQDPAIFQRGKGIIVDSGTTDTYLPRSVAKGFSAAWERATGSPYANCKDNHFCMILTSAELEALPTVTIHMDGGLEVNVRPSGYMDALGKDNAYAPRIYLTESMGGVLGANVMLDHNVVFDYENHLVGFAEGVCDYRADNQGSVPGGVGAQEKLAQQEVPADEDCVTAKKRVQKCNARCPKGLEEPETIKGNEIWEDVIITHPKGSGKACPEAMEKESRECVEDCPADPLVLEGDEKATKEGGDGEKKEATEGGGGEPAVQLVVRAGGVESSTQGTYCSIDQELWTECSLDCLQERFLDDECGKEAEARACNLGNVCPTSKAGLLLSVGVGLKIDVGDAGVSEEHSELWLTWLGTTVADAVAELTSLAAGNVEAAVTCTDPRAADIAAFGGAAGASFDCEAKVEMHLTPKVDSVAADKVAQVFNNGTGSSSSFSASLSAALQWAKRQHWLLSGVTVAAGSAGPVSVFIASNGEAYHPQESNRLQSARPGRSGSGPQGARLMLTLAGVVVAVLAALVLRVKHLRVPGEGEGRPSGAAAAAAAAVLGYRRVDEVEMSARGGGHSRDASRELSIRSRSPSVAAASGGDGGGEGVDSAEGRFAVRRTVGEGK
ncbi:aspartic protease PM5 [Ectocarpus siliculosus]|uniref:Aspartic protease PM5 n=1 Tax=Ectocarpus siliculosus TaxID=2880 RepID=D8LJA6_ECTSI|nr:aspartic protease PM5 [Ectocarpus siliculosus]|eukprot:CBN76990.1 aspartic protease PM5 [Ectocarpus siliculosus]